MRKKRYGLVGRNISYSFSKGYFTKMFQDLNLEHHSYENFDLKNIEELETFLENSSDLKGLNVTIPYKQDVLPFLSKVDNIAFQIGAVNTIKVTDDQLIGFNTDVIGFNKSLKPHLKSHHKNALILGTGGASKAVAYVLEELGLSHKFVSRHAHEHQLGYPELDKDIIAKYTVLINCTPLGTYPDIENRPEIPYHFLGKKHLLYDLIYNPVKTAFLKYGEERGASIVNGQKMLELQAEASWEIWNR
ncbi:MAG: shikimate dehydrogenase family protein [Aurantibacter sp.]